MADGRDRACQCGAGRQCRAAGYVAGGCGGCWGEIKELVEFWYAEANPAVCEFMTAKMLDFGWGKTGDAGRDLCRTNLAQAEPIENVKVRRPRVDGDTAKVEVVYSLDGERQFDRISLVRRDDEWLVDSVVLAGFASE